MNDALINALLKATFPAGFIALAAFFAASFLTRKGKSTPKWLGPIVLALVCAFAFVLLKGLGMPGVSVASWSVVIALAGGVLGLFERIWPHAHKVHWLVRSLFLAALAWLITRGQLSTWDSGTGMMMFVGTIALGSWLIAALNMSAQLSYGPVPPFAGFFAAFAVSQFAMLVCSSQNDAFLASSLAAGCFGIGVVSLIRPGIDLSCGAMTTLGFLLTANTVAALTLGYPEPGYAAIVLGTLMFAAWVPVFAWSASRSWVGWKRIALVLVLTGMGFGIVVGLSVFLAPPPIG